MSSVGIRQLLQCVNQNFNGLIHILYIAVGRHDHSADETVVKNNRRPITACHRHTRHVVFAKIAARHLQRNIVTSPI